MRIAMVLVLPALMSPLVRAQGSVPTQTAGGQAARAGGQEDDITILTLAFAPVEALHA